MGENTEVLTESQVQALEAAKEEKEVGKFPDTSIYVVHLYDIFTLAILLTGYFHVLKIKETIQARVSVALVVSALSTFVTHTVVAYVIEFEGLLFHLSGILYICLPMLAGLKWHKELAMFCISPFGK